jgi:hypothetical protein
LARPNLPNSVASVDAFLFAGKTHLVCWLRSYSSGRCPDGLSAHPQECSLNAAVLDSLAEHFMGLIRRRYSPVFSRKRPQDSACLCG